MSSLFGWIGGAPVAQPGELLGRMAASAHADGSVRSESATPAGALGTVGLAATQCVVERDGVQLALVGHPHVGGVVLTGPAAQPHALAFMERLSSQGAAALRELHGDFALALLEPARGRALLAIDRLGVHPLSWQQQGGLLAFGSTLDTLACHPQARRELSQQALYDYLFFHVVAGPGTIYRDCWRLAAGCALVFEEGRARTEPYWQMQFREAPAGDPSVSGQRFFDTLEAATARAAAGSACGSFLSGGTDSSTIAGLLKRTTGRARTYSIGFEEGGFDEMEYARIASRHFGTEHHEYYVTPADVCEAAPRIAQVYDQPFGNASAIPTYFCARMAQADGIERLLGGDGGDELFGGNARYGKQTLFAHYHRLPAALRSGLLEPLLLGPSFTQSVPLVRKLRSYIEQARPPMPERYESYNLLEHLKPARVLMPEFLAAVDTDVPHALMRDAHAPYRDASLVNQMLGIDLRFTLADNDLPKVTRMCALAGADIAFPMLDDEVVAFSAALPRADKLRGTTLRPFFKESLSGFLPPQIITKQKHGFGLPVGHWLARDPALGALAQDSLAWLAPRGIVRPEFIDELRGTLLHEHPNYYGTMVWLLVVLSLWMQSRRL